MYSRHVPFIVLTDIARRIQGECAICQQLTDSLLFAQTAKPSLNCGPQQGCARNVNMCVLILKPVVTLCTTNLNIKKFYILPTEYLYVLYVTQKKKPKLSLYSPQSVAIL